MAKGIENRARSPPAVFDFATSQIQKHGGTKMYYDLVESGKRIKALRKEHGLTQEQLAEQLGVAANTIARISIASASVAVSESPKRVLMSGWIIKCKICQGRRTTRRQTSKHIESSIKCSHDKKHMATFFT